MNPKWLPTEYLTCPSQLAMKKIEDITPAGYFCILEKPHFLSKDRLGVDPKFYLTHDHLPSNNNPVQVIMEGRGRYEDYKFGNRHAVAAAKARKEREGSQTAPPITPPAEGLDKPVPADLRSLLTPKKENLRATIKNRTPSAPRKVKMVLVTPDPNSSGPGVRAGQD